MSLTADQIFIEALSLPARVRAELVNRLVASLEDDEKIDEAWRTEALARCKAFDEGKITDRGAEDVMRDLYAKLK